MACGTIPSRRSSFPMRGASRSPRAFKGRSWSGIELSPQLDLACRMINKVFIVWPGAPAAGRKGIIFNNLAPRWYLRASGQSGHNGI